jgi:hypothetical protein
MHVDHYNYEKRIMKLENFSLEFSSPKEPYIYRERERGRVYIYIEPGLTVGACYA